MDQGREWVISLTQFPFFRPNLDCGQGNAR